MTAFIKRKQLLFSKVSSAWRTALQQTPTGTYTPTATGVLNLDSVTAGTGIYTRINDFVVMSGSHQADATAAGGTDTLFRVTLPIASNFSGAGDCRGVGMLSVPNTVIEIFSDAGTDQISFYWKSTNTALNGLSYVLCYRII